MSDNARGLFGKFHVERTDGTSAPGGKHDGCDYFVLDLSHDPYAYKAIMRYADACALTHPQLSDDLHEKARQMGSWMIQKHFAEMSPAHRQQWKDMVHNDPERR